MGKITTRRFNKILSVVDEKNIFDFDSFAEAIISIKIGVTKDTLDNILDFLILDLGINCDAELIELPQSKLKEIIIGMNDIVINAYQGVLLE
ncbi:MAG: hypothetical protein JEZ08_11895 [Clostridiales bacterium]|nr:hypothetical protein [Clostridiales bacterium]